MDRDGEKAIKGVKESWYKLTKILFIMAISHLSKSTRKKALKEYNDRKDRANYHITDDAVRAGSPYNLPSYQLQSSKPTIYTLANNARRSGTSLGMDPLYQYYYEGGMWNKECRLDPPKKSKNLLDHVVDFGGKVVDGAKTVVDTVGGALNEVGKAFGEAWNWLGNNVANILTGIALVATVIGAAALVTAMLAIGAVPFAIGAAANAATLLTIAVGSAMVSTLILVGKELSGMGTNVLDNILGVINIVISYGASVAQGFISAGKEAKKLPAQGSVNLRDASNSVNDKYGGSMSDLKNGHKIEIPNGNKPIVVRIMDEGSGGRTAPYFRVSIDGKGSLTLDGILSNDQGLTHIDLTNNYLEQIINMIDKYRGGR